MKRLKICLAIVLLISPLPVIAISKALYAADNVNRSGPASVIDTSKISYASYNVNKAGGTIIKEYKDKITVEREAIIEDGRRLQEAKKTGDKTKIEQVKQEVDQDIRNRKARISALYNDMGNKTDTKFNNNYSLKRK